MRTSDPSTTVKHDSGPVPARDSLDQTGKAAHYLFDASLSTAIAANEEQQATVPVPKGPLTPDMLDKMHRHWQAANYLCIGQIYLFEN